jgi:hypothetical protein
VVKFKKKNILGTLLGGNKRKISMQRMVSFFLRLTLQKPSKEAHS